MKKIVFTLIILFSQLLVFAQFERLDSISLLANVNEIKCHFSIMRRNNPQKVINDYRAMLVISEKDTFDLYHDSIVNIKLFPDSFLTSEGVGDLIINPKPIKLIINYNNKHYEMHGVEKYLTSSLVNIWFIINSFCIGSEYVHHSHSSIFRLKSKFWKPDIYTEALHYYIPKSEPEYLPDSVIIKQNYKKNKYIIPHW
jgi:hypothetical protein